MGEERHVYTRRMLSISGRVKRTAIRETNAGWGCDPQAIFQKVTAEKKKRERFYLRLGAAESRVREKERDGGDGSSFWPTVAARNATATTTLRDTLSEAPAGAGSSQSTPAVDTSVAGSSQTPTHT